MLLPKTNISFSPRVAMRSDATRRPSIMLVLLMVFCFSFFDCKGTKKNFNLNQ